MKRSSFTTRDGLIMLIGITLALIGMMSLILAGVVRVNH
jgi:hypothetical protein